MAITTRLIVIDKDSFFTITKAWSASNNFKAVEKKSNSVKYQGAKLTNSGFWLVARHDGKIGYLDVWWENGFGMKFGVDKKIPLNPTTQRLKKKINSLLATFGVAKL